MSNLDLMKAGTGLAIVIGIALTAVVGYALSTMFGGIDGLTVAPELLVSVLFGGLTIAAVTNVRRVVLKPRARI